MQRRLSRQTLGTALFLAALAACSSDKNNGPPSAPCNDQTKGAAPVCGKTCANKCGCGTCTDGEQRFIDSALYVCATGCFAYKGGGTGGSSSGGGSGTGGAATGGQNSGGAAGLDCKTVDCNADPPVCNGCSTCACCTCTNGESKDIGGVAHVCGSLGCFQPLSGDGG